MPTLVPRIVQMTAPAAMSAETRRTVRSTELGLVVMALIWGLNFAVLKYGTTVLEPIAYNAIRMSLGTVVLLGVACAMAPLPSRRDIAKLMLLGILGHGVYQGLFINGLALTRAGTAALVVAAAPAVIAIVGRALGVERITRRSVFGIAMSLIGVAIVVLGSARNEVGAEGDVRGDLLILCSVVAWAFYTTFLGPYTTRIRGMHIAGWTLLGGTIPIIIVATPALLRTSFADIAPLTWGAIAYSGLGAIGLAYLFWYRGVRVLGSTRTSMYAQLQPLIGLLAAWPLIGEKPTAWQIAGSAAVMSGLLLTRVPHTAEPAHGE
ncbi:MAG: DMT family transporter [Gemmatimonadetes bacterium]|nr:DMT family transporter [Gemmatimonadota bacterium]